MKIIVNGNALTLQGRGEEAVDLRSMYGDLETNSHVFYDGSDPDERPNFSLITLTLRIGESYLTVMADDHENAARLDRASRRLAHGNGAKFISCREEDGSTLVELQLLSD